jgi:8-amino-7-oxononanoate synthase
LHAELESALAQFTGRPACLVYSTGYLANLGAVTALSDPGTLIVSDAHVHASLVDACRLARRARLHVNGHNDIDDVARALRDRAEPRAMVLCESVYSVLGDPAPLAELVQVTQEYDAVLVVDEAHAIGVAGPGGRGMLAGVVGSGGGTPAGVAASGGTPAGVEGSGGTSTGVGSRDDPAHVVTTLTLSKALGAQGGAVLGSVAVTEHLINTSRAFIYDTGLAPAAAAAALRAVELVRSDPGLPARALHLARRLSHGLGLPTPAGAVLSVPMAGPGEAVAAQARLREAGFLVGCFRPPSVPDGVSRLRLTAKASLADGDVDKVLVELAALIGDR